MDEMLKLLSVLTGDQRFTEGWTTPEDKEADNMGEKWIDEIENRGIARGIALGEARGEVRGAVKAYRSMGKTDEEISTIMEKPVDVIKGIK